MKRFDIIMLVIAVAIMLFSAFMIGYGKALDTIHEQYGYDLGPKSPVVTIKDGRDGKHPYVIRDADGWYYGQEEHSDSIAEFSACMNCHKNRWSQGNGPSGLMKMEYYRYGDRDARDIPAKHDGPFTQNPAFDKTTPKG